MSPFILQVSLGAFSAMTLLSTTMSAPLPPEHQSHTLETLLPLEEAEKVKQEAERQSRDTPSTKTHGAAAETVNPYGSALKQQKTPPKIDTKQEEAQGFQQRKATSPSARKRRYDRYKTGNRRPGDSLKSTPAQRTFGK